MSRLRLRSDDLQWREVDGEIVVLDLRTSVYFVVNGAGAMLWEQLSAGATQEDLEHTLSSRYGLPAREAARDVDEFTSDLRRKTLLEA